MGNLRLVVLGAMATLLFAACQPPNADAVALPDDTPTPTAEATLSPAVDPTLMPTPVAIAEPTPTVSLGHDATPTPTAVSQSETFDAPTPTPAGEQADGCVSDPTPTFSVVHTELDKVSFISPMIVPSGDWLKNRSYFALKTDPETGDGYEVSAYAPTDAVLTGITRYIESVMDNEGNLQEQDQYDLVFQVSCEVSFGFDHVGRLVGEAADVQPTVAAHDTRDAQKQVRVEYKAGDLVGYSKGTSGAHTWDFIMTSTESTIQYANQLRYETMGDLQRMLTAACPYDYYDEPIRSQYLELFGGWAGLMTGAETCLGSPDVLGSIAGGWFGSPFAGDQYQVADWALVVVHTADNRVEINDAQRSVRTDASHSTHIAPRLVTTEHCYQDYNTPAQFAYLKLLAADQIAYAIGDGMCPVSLPADYSVAYR